METSSSPLIRDIPDVMIKILRRAAYDAESAMNTSQCEVHTPELFWKLRSEGSSRKIRKLIGKKKFIKFYPKTFDF